MMSSDERIWIAAVSDGAGSGRLSHFSSAVAVRSSTFALRRMLERNPKLNPNLLKDVLLTTSEDVFRLHRVFLAAGTSVSRDDFACTLILLAMDSDNLMFAQIGDGAVVISSGNVLRCLSREPEREYINETVFVTTPGAIDDAQIGEADIDTVEGVAIMTDGVQNLGIRYPGNEPFAGLFQPVFEYMMSHRAVAREDRDGELEVLLDSPQFNSETDDDKTLLVAVRMY